MKLLTFRIKGFKSITDSGECKLSENDNITVLAGQNEAGKSATLEALDFFRNGAGPDFVRLQKRQDMDSTVVSCKFKIEDTDIIQLNEQINNAQVASFIEQNLTFTATRNSEGGSTQEIVIDPDYYSTLIEDLNTLTPIVAEDGVMPIDPAPTVDETIKKFNEILIKAMPAVTLYRYFTDFLPSEILVSEIPNNSAVRDFETVFSSNLTTLANISDPRQLETTRESLQQKATDDFNVSWSQKLSITDETKYQYIIQVNQQEPKKIVFMIKGSDGNPLYLEQKSMGFRWFSAFHLRLRAMGADSSQLKNLILLVDEPGQNLHETAQVDAKKVLEELASKGARVIYSTHNAKLIGTEGGEFARIRLVSNSKDRGTRIETVSQFASRADQSNLDALSPIITAMGLSSISPFIDRNRLNIVVEGISDHYYLSAFKKLLSKDERLVFVPACGVTNVPNLVSVLLGWGFNHKAVFDDDRDSGRKAYNLLKKEFYEGDDIVAHENILKIKDCNGIEDIFSKKDFEKFVIGRVRESDELNKSNSEVVRESGKEMHGRIFLEKIEKGENIVLDKDTQDKINEVFSWVYEKFSITE